MSRFFRPLVTVCLCLGTIRVALAQPGQPLPPGDPWPRTAAEYEAQRQEPWRQIPLPEEVPDIWQAWWVRAAAWDQKYTGPGLVYDAALADELIAELWVDTGHPSLNNGSQDCVLDIVSELVNWPEDRFPRTARERVIRGLLAYVQAGGGQNAPVHQYHLADVLANVAPHDPQVKMLAHHLLTDALEWASSIGCKGQYRSALRVCAKHLGGEYLWQLHELEAELPTEGRPEGYERACAALLALLRSGPSVRPNDLLGALRDAAQLASVKLDDDRLSDDLTCRLLIVYRILLERRPMIPSRVADYIDRQLLALHAKERLRSGRHWGLWGGAVKALEAERISRRFQRYLNARLDKKDLLPVERGTLERLRPLLRK